jgi:hypothetical protein
VRNCRIRNNTDVPTFIINEVEMPADQTARLENVHVTGTGTGPLLADPGTQAEIYNSCVLPNFPIVNFDVISEVSDSDCVDAGRP